MKRLNSYFGIFGGMYVPQSILPALFELEDAFINALRKKDFIKENKYLLKNYAGRPTPLTLCRNITKGTNSKIYLKREDLLHSGAHKINQVIGQALLAKQMGKKEIIAETGAGQHGVASSIVSALLGLKCRIYMGAKDISRQLSNVYRMKLLGSKIISVSIGASTLKDACNEALRYWSFNYENSHYILGTAAGPHPYPTIVREFQSIIGKETKKQIIEKEKKMPDYVIACVGGGSNAIGIFNDFINESTVKLIGVEPGGLGIKTEHHGAAINTGKIGIYLGMKTLILQSYEGQIKNSHSISAGLDFPSIGPQHAYLNSINRVKYVYINDNDSIKAFKLLSCQEGIIPALESSHALAYALKIINKNPYKKNIIVVNLSGRGDKDINTVYNRHKNE